MKDLCSPKHISRLLHPLLLLLATAALLATSCAKKEKEAPDPALPRLEAIEAIIDDYPDSAATSLHAISPDTLRTPASRALYYLLATRIHNREQIVIPTDSFINKSISYYSETKDWEHLVESYIQNGYRLLYNQEYPIAMISVWEGLDVIKDKKHPLYEGRLHQLAGEIHFGMNDVISELDSRKIAFDKYAEAKDTLHRDYALVSYTTCLINNRKYQYCLDFSRQEHFLNPDPSPLFVKELNENEGICLFALNQYDKAILKLRIADSISEYGCSAFGYNRLAKAYLIKNNVDSAIYWLDILHRKYPHEISYYNGMKSLYMHRGDFHNALKMTDSASLLQDNAINEMLSKQFGNTLATYFIEKSNLTQQLRKRDRLITIIVLSIIVIICIFTIYLFYLRNQKIKDKRDALISDIIKISQQLRDKEQITNNLTKQIKLQESTISEAQSIIKQKENSLSKLIEATDSLFRSKHSTLNKLCIEYYESSDSESAKKMLYRRIQTELEKLSQPKTIAKIEEEVNSTYNNIIADLRCNLDTFKEDDFIFLSYLKAGFSPRIICTVCKINLSNFYVKKKRLKDRLKKYQGEKADFFVSAFDDL